MHHELARKFKIFIKRKFLDNKVERSERFSKVYRDAVWGMPEDDFSIFWSGSGSKNININEYTDYVCQFCSENMINSIAEIGCGDFRVANNLLQKISDHGLFVNYIGIDIVDEVIQYNKEHFENKRITFLCMDAVVDQIPYADLYLVREVFQHLNNQSIEAILSKLENQSRYAIITELHPTNLWKANVDYIEGASSRNKYKTGVYLDKPPFNRKCEHVLSIQHSDSDKAILETYLMRMGVSNNI